MKLLIKKILTVCLIMGSFFLFNQSVHAYDPDKGLTVEAWNRPCTTADYEECWNDPVNLGDARKTVQYIPLKATDVTKKWKLCVSFPHLKDAWWLAQNHGIIDEARPTAINLA